LAEKSGNSYAVESCHIKIKDTDISAHIWRFLFDTARQYRESFDVYGTKKSFEWSLVEGKPHLIHTAKKPEHEIPSEIEVPDYAHLLPEPIRPFVVHSRWWTRGVAPSLGQRVRNCLGRESRPLAQCRHEC
jgi:hypothetical protein